MVDQSSPLSHHAAWLPLHENVSEYTSLQWQAGDAKEEDEEVPPIKKVSPLGDVLVSLYLTHASDSS